MIQTIHPLTPRQARQKRLFDVLLATLVLAVTGWSIPLLAWLARRDTGATGIFRQERVGQDGKVFQVMKIRTMRGLEGIDTTVTRQGDARITPLGARLRRYKLDELPQFWNVLRGDMSLVGPRPDVRGYYDMLPPPADVLLTLRPGITSLAALEFRHEEALLASVTDPVRYNDEVLFPAKVDANLRYLDGWTIRRDIACVAATGTSILASILTAR